MYFAIYQALAEDERRVGLFRDYPPDFFDLIIIDECHRGSARDKQQIAAIDPTGAWWGLRSSATGEGPGFPVVVFGGGHADVPLEPHAGRMLARALVEHGFSAIFDVGLMLTDDQIRFTSDFASELLRINRTALHLYIDEADTFAPQMTEGNQQKLCLGTVSHLVKQGGIRGVGVDMISQRPTSTRRS